MTSRIFESIEIKAIHQEKNLPFNLFKMEEEKHNDSEVHKLEGNEHYKKKNF